LHQDLLVVFSS